ncbi:MAG: DUF721 domain-containing protein [Gammaproteobacteria bacterium]|nr:DUF721 domain-containing protein [Gammaproteobacteria bacterium]
MARAVSGLLQSNNKTRMLVSKAWSLAKLQDAITEALPIEIRALGSIQPGNLVDGELTLLAANPALATRLRFSSKTILDAIRKEGRLKVNRIKVRVAPPRPQLRKPVKKVPRKLSSEDQTVLLRAAKTTSDPALAAVFRRLADRKASR